MFLHVLAVTKRRAFLRAFALCFENAPDFYGKVTRKNKKHFV